MFDGTKTHFSRAVRDVLNNTYHNRWIGIGGPTTLARFDSSGFLPVGTPKSTVYAAPVDNEEAHRIVDVCQTIRNYSGIFERMRWSMTKRVHWISRRTI
jgi:hypothetical protein